MVLTGLGPITYTGPSPVYVDTSGIMTISAIPTVSSGSPTAYTVEYSSSDANIVVNSSTGVITILGTATPGSYGLIAYVTNGIEQYWSNYDFIISSYPVTGISSISFVGTVVNDPTLQNLGYSDHSHYTYTNATVRAVASVSPANATNKTVTWSYVNNSGSPVSAIDASGNITLSGTEGIVTLTARAQDTSSGSYNSTIKMSVVYPDYTFDITNNTNSTDNSIRTDSTGKKWIEYRNYSASVSVMGNIKLELRSTANGAANTNYMAFNSSTNNQVGFGNISSDGSSSSTYDNYAFRTTPLYANLPKLNGVNYIIYARRLGAYYLKYNARVQDALSSLAVSINSTTSGPAATTGGAYSYFYLGSTVVVQAELQIYGSTNIADIADASMNWITGPEFTVTPLVGTYTVGGVGGFFLSGGKYYRRASITVNSYTATPTLSIKATSPDTINSSFNPVIRRSVTGMNSVTGTTTVQVGSTTTLSSSVQPANAYNQTINWSSSDITKATVNSSGVVTGVAPGTATITAASAESAAYSSTATVTVTGIAATSISAITFTGSTPVHTNSTSLSVSATVSPANATNKGVVYTSSNTSVATVNSSTGAITPVAAGTTTITATASDTTNGTLSSTYSLTVYNPVAAISSITRTGFPATVYTDSSGMSISATITTSNVANSSVSYSSSATGVATVNASTGAITIVGVGSVTLTATSAENGAVSSTTSFTVYNRVTAMSELTLSWGTATVYTNSTGLSISATITTSNVVDSSVTYSSTDESVASINSSTGVLTIVAAGTTELRAASVENSGVYKTYSLTVNSIMATTITSAIIKNASGTTLTQIVLGASYNYQLAYHHTFIGQTTDQPAIYITRSGTSTTNVSFTVYDATTNTVINSGDFDISGMSIDDIYLIRQYPGSGVYKIEASIDNGSVYTIYLQIKADITNVISSAPTSTEEIEATFSAYNVTQGQTIQLNIIRSDSTNSDTITYYIADIYTGLSSSGISIAQDGTVTATTIGLYSVNIVLNGVYYYTTEGLSLHIKVNAPQVSITNVTSTASTTTVTVNGESKTAFVATTSEAWEVPITITRSDNTNTDNITVVASFNGTTYSPYSFGTNNTSIIYGSDSGVTTIELSIDGSTADPYIFYVYYTSTVSVSGISSTTLSGGSAPFYTTTTGLSVSASVTPNNATNQTVVYDSSNSAVATVNSSTGAITIVGAGSTRLTSTSSDGAYTSYYDLTVSTPPTVNTTGLAEITSDHTVYNVGNYNDRIIYVGSTETSVQLYTSVQPENATNQSVTWEFYNTPTRTDATISSTGLVTFTAGSSAFFNNLDPLVLQGGFSKRIIIARTQPPANTNSIYSQGTVGTYTTMNDIVGGSGATVSVTGISSTSLSGGSTPVYVGATGLSVSATVTPNNATNQTVIYDSSNSAVATVNSSTGAITIIGAGSTRLTSTSSSGSYTSYYDLTVYNRPSAISALTGSWGSSTVYTTSTGLSVSASVTTSNVYNSAVVYDSSNSAVATVNSSTGAITIVGAGTTTLSAIPSDNTNNVTRSTLLLTVSAPLPPNSVTSMTDIVLTSNDPMHPNQWNSGSVTVGPANASDKSVTWTTSNSSIINIWDDDGITQDVVILAKGVGRATLRATSVSNTNVFKEIEIQVYARTTGMLAITYTGSTPLRVGETATLGTVVYPSTTAYQSVTWSSSDTGIATVDTNGVVTAVAAGSAVISAISVGIPVRTVTRTLTITAAATRVTGISAITYSGSSPFRVNGTGCSVSATVEPTTATNTQINYSSSDETVASVSSTTGQLTGNRVGTCTITATTADGGHSSEYFLTVDVEYIAVQSVSTPILTGPSPLRVNSTGVSINSTASGLAGATPTNTGVLYYTNTVSVCSVDKNTGVVTFKEAGTARFYAIPSDNPTIRSEILTITVLPAFVALTGISDISANNQSPVLVSGSKTLYIRNGGTLQLRASPVPANATNNEITWASSSAGITVDASGLATSITTDADSIITATDASGNSKTVNLKHIVNVQGVNLISLNPDSPLEINTTSVASSGTYPGNATYPGVTWSASPSGIVTIDQSGNISAIAPGNTTIYATAIDNSGITEFYPVTVSVPFVEINGMSQITYTGPKYLHVAETGGRVVANVTPTNATNQAVTYTWSPTNLLSIDASGNITALASGTATIYASATETNGITVHDNDYVLVIYPQTVNITGIDCLEPDVVLDIGSTIGFRNPMLPPYATNNQVTWVSADPGIASVNENGTVTGVTRGTTTIIATSAVDNSLNSSYEITVSSVPVSDITPIGTSTSAYSMVATYTLQLTAQVVPSNSGNKAINWLVSDTSLATIDASGLLTAIAPGSVIVRASADDNANIYRETTITIAPKPVTGISAITAPSNVRTIELNSTMTLSANVLPADATNKLLIWTSNLPSVIEIVDASAGIIRGKLISGSTVVITATTVEGNHRAFYNMTCVAIKVQDMDPITTSTGDTVMNISDSLTLITQVLPTTAAQRDYAWAYNAQTANALQLMQSVTSLNTNTGTVSALTTGYASFKATSGGLTNAGEYVVKTITIQVGEPVQSLTPIFYGMSSILQANQTKQLTTTIVPTSATQTGIFWASSQTGSATVSQTGVITVARMPQTKVFTITATPTPYNLDASGNIISVSQTFTITIPVTGISAVSPSRTLINVGESRNMIAYIQPINADNKSITLSVVSAKNSAGQDVVDTSTILSSSGLSIIGVAKGSAVIKIASVENSAIFSTLSMTIA